MTDKNRDDSGFGSFELRIGGRGFKLTGPRGLLIFAAGCVAVKLAFMLATGGFEENNKPPADTIPVSAPATRERSP